MPQPGAVDEATLQIRDAYHQAWRRIQHEQAMLQGDPTRWRRRARLREIEKSIARELHQLEDELGDWLARAIPRAYMLGATEAAAAAGTEWGWTTVAREAVYELATDLFADLLRATRRVEATTKSLIREVARDQALQSLTAGPTATQSARRMRELIAEHGIHAVRYANGAKVGLDQYAEMAIRTKTATAYNLGALQATPEVRWYEVFDGPGCGWSYHDDPTQALGLIVPREEAERYPISHPNCRRSFGPRPDVTTAKEAKEARGQVTAEQVAAQRAQDEARRALQARRQARRAQSRRKAFEGHQGNVAAAQARHKARSGRVDTSPPHPMLAEVMPPASKYDLSGVPGVDELVDKGMSFEEAVAEHKRLKRNEISRQGLAAKRARLKAEAAAAAGGPGPARVGGIVAEDAKLGPDAPPIALYDHNAATGATGPGAVTGDGYHAALRRDTDKIIPIEGLTTLHGEHTVRIERGIATRRDGIIYMLEGDPADPALRAGLEKVVATTRQTLLGIPHPLIRDELRTIIAVKARNPSDPFWAKYYKSPGFTSGATGGNRTITFWNGTRLTPGTLSHELGHLAEDAIRRTTDASELVSEGGAWALARAEDAITSRRFLSEFIHQPASSDLMTPGVRAVTDYAAHHAREDFAESVRLWLRDRALGRVGHLEGPEGVTALRFHDVFPERARILDELMGTPGPALEARPFHTAALVKADDLLADAGLTSLLALDATPGAVLSGIMEATGVSRRTLRSRIQLGLIQEIVDAKEAAERAAAAAKTAAQAATLDVTKRSTRVLIPKIERQRIARRKLAVKQKHLAAGATEQAAQEAADLFEREALVAALRAQGVDVGGPGSGGAAAGRPMDPTWVPDENTKARGFFNDAGKRSTYNGSQDKRAKDQLVGELTERLNNPTDWEEFRRARRNLGHRDPGAFNEVTEAARRTAIYEEVNERIRFWAQSSGDKYTEPLAMQRAISDEFGVAPNRVFVRGVSEHVRRQANIHYDKVSGFYRRVVRRMYENTQEELQKAGIDRVSVYRGMDFTAGPFDEPLQVPSWARPGLHRPELQPANSWSTDKTVARRFGDTMLSASIPRERILGSARTGFGCLSEFEYVILDTEGRVTVSKLH